MTAYTKLRKINFIKVTTTGLLLRSNILKLLKSNLGY